MGNLHSVLYNDNGKQHALGCSWIDVFYYKPDEDNDYFKKSREYITAVHDYPSNEDFINNMHNCGADFAKFGCECEAIDSGLDIEGCRY